MKKIPLLSILLTGAVVGLSTNLHGTTVTTDPVEAETSTVNANTDVLSDDDLAASYRSQADRMFKEAKRLREQAEELAPTKKKKTATQSA